MTVDTKLLATHFPFESRTFERNGLKMHYVDEGSGEPLVMVHGNPTWSFFFRYLISDLRVGYRTIALDHIGCGLSDKPDCRVYDYRLHSRIDDLEALIMRRIPEGPLTLVLHDWGGAIGLGFAARHPNRVKRLILFNTAGFGLPEGKAFPWPLQIFKHFRLGAWLNRGLNAFALISAWTCSQKGLSREVRELFLGPYDSWENRVATTRFVQDIPLTPQDDSWPELCEIEQGLTRLAQTPTLVCWGRKDFIFDRAFYQEWKRRMPHAEFHSFRDAGHYLLEDKGPEIRDLVRAFLRHHP